MNEFPTFQTLSKHLELKSPLMEEEYQVGKVYTIHPY